MTIQYLYTGGFTISLEPATIEKRYLSALSGYMGTKQHAATYHIKGREVDTFISIIRKLIQDGDELTIIVTSKKKAEKVVSTESEKEKLFYSLFGNWEGEETGDELVKEIYVDRVSATRDIEL